VTEILQVKLEAKTWRNNLSKLVDNVAKTRVKVGVNTQKGDPECIKVSEQSNATHQ